MTDVPPLMEMPALGVPKHLNGKVNGNTVLIPLVQELLLQPLSLCLFLLAMKQEAAVSKIF